MGPWPSPSSPHTASFASLWGEAEIVDWHPKNLTFLLRRLSGGWQICGGFSSVGPTLAFCKAPGCSSHICLYWTHCWLCSYPGHLLGPHLGRSGNLQIQTGPGLEDSAHCLYFQQQENTVGASPPFFLSLLLPFLPSLLFIVY